jgi:hypothetical protein
MISPNPKCKPSILSRLSCEMPSLRIAFVTSKWAIFASSEANRESSIRRSQRSASLLMNCRNRKTLEGCSPRFCVRVFAASGGDSDLHLSQHCNIGLALPQRLPEAEPRRSSRLAAPGIGFESGVSSWSGSRPIQNTAAPPTTITTITPAPTISVPKGRSSTRTLDQPTLPHIMPFTLSITAATPRASEAGPFQAFTR